MITKSKKNILLVIILISVCLISICTYRYISSSRIETNYVISSIGENEIEVVECKWIYDKVKATELGLLDYYKNYFEFPAGRYSISKKDVKVKDEKGHKISWNDLRSGDEIVITQKNGIKSGTIGVIENVISIKLKEKMIQRVQ